MKDVICQGCNKPIRRRSELAVVGKTFLTYHRDCYARASLGTRFVHGYRINGPALWYILFLINGMMFGALFFLPNVKMDGEFKTILVFGNAVIIGIRLLSYIFVELRVPKD